MTSIREQIAEQSQSSLKGECPVEMRAYALRKYRKNVDPNFPHFTFHSMRHMFADSLNQGGVNPKNTQYIMGHSNVDITVNTYMHTNREKAISDYRDKFGS